MLCHHQSTLVQTFATATQLTEQNIQLFLINWDTQALLTLDTMKACLTCFLTLLLSGYAVTACKKQDDNPACGAPNLISVDTNCSTGKGLVVTASGYSGSPSSFDWTIIALKDTTNELGWTPKDIKYDGPGTSAFTVADSLVTAYQKLIISAASNCQGTLYHSITYGFIKRQSATSPCSVWKPVKR